jgi:hypothetical protein
MMPRGPVSLTVLPSQLSELFLIVTPPATNTMSFERFTAGPYYLLILRLSEEFFVYITLDLYFAIILVERKL